MTESGAGSGAATGHQHFIDWMKATGMVLIVIGHVVGDPQALFNAVSEPVYSKQLGVAFFVFVAGWGLANAHRPRWQEAFNRVFAIYFYGLVCALALSVIYFFTRGDLNESNYLPLFFGINVLLNYFPANPTTWYIGMYLHLILLWALLAPKRISLPQLVAVALLEVAVRGVILDAGRPFTAYMLVSNWLTVFVLGYYLAGVRDLHQPGRALAIALLWLLVLGSWYLLPLPLRLDEGFPTRLPGEGLVALVATAALVTLVYLANTLFAFAVFRRVPGNAITGFIARNTLLIFILHMPLIYALSPVLQPLIETDWLRRTTLILLVLLSLGLFSEAVNRLLPINSIRRRAWQTGESVLRRRAR